MNNEPSKTECDQHMYSGFIKTEDIQSLPTQDNQTYICSSWITAPASWPVKQVLMQCAHETGVTINIDSETSGWVFKRNKYFFKAEGTKERVRAFTARWVAAVNRGFNPKNDEILKQDDK